MGNIERHLTNATSIFSLHHMGDLWKSARGTVLRIQALVVVAIIITFSLAAFGSCRRWSNSWIVQKGFFAAHALSLSLGTYSIGLMQSSSVKSQMYPIWTVSLFTLFGCIDPVTAYNGLDYNGPLSKMVYQIFLHCGYVLLMSISTISNVVGNTAIGVLCAITFIKGFHRSLALVQQSRMRNMVQHLPEDYGGTSVLRNDPTHRTQRYLKIVDFPTGMNGSEDAVTVGDIDKVLREQNKYELGLCYDVCIAFCLSHNLQRHFLGLSYCTPLPETLKGIDYRWALKVIEIELAFLYEVFFTGNAFSYYYQAETSSLWAYVSLLGIFFVGVAAATPETMGSSRTTSVGGCTKVVNTTTADLVITFIILGSLALLQLMHLIRCWTSNWAKVAVACAYVRVSRSGESGEFTTPSSWLRWWMKLKAFVATKTNWFDKCLWQDKIGQYSILPEGRLAGRRQYRDSSRRECKLLFHSLEFMVHYLYRLRTCLVKMLGLDYIGEVLWGLLGSVTNKGFAIRLDDDVKASIIDFLGQIATDRLDGNWSYFSNSTPIISPYLPYSTDRLFMSESHGYRYASCAMMWHIATWYCELAEQKRDALRKAEERMGCGGIAASYFKKAAAAVAGRFKKEAAGGEQRVGNRNRHVANALSKYCTCLVVSAPELLPGPALDTTTAYDRFVNSALREDKDKLLGALSDTAIWTELYTGFNNGHVGFRGGVSLAVWLLGDHPPLHDVTQRSDPWETLALVWVRMLVYAAPYGNVEGHMRCLAQGGEFITHLWALLYHLDIREWKLPETNLHNITTIEDAEKIITEDDFAVIAFLGSLSGSYYDELVAVSSNIKTGVRVYQTLSADIARRFRIDPAVNCPALVFWNRVEDNFTLHDHGEFRANDIARFLTENNLVVTTQAWETAPSGFDSQIDMQARHIVYN
ncbi:unnamed protein product [Urochloa humidicola]